MKHLLNLSFYILNLSKGLFLIHISIFYKLIIKLIYFLKDTFSDCDNYNLRFVILGFVLYLLFANIITIVNVFF